jgi:hypothetical protein
MTPPFVGVAFRRGEPGNIMDSVVMAATRGPFVHAEFCLGVGVDIRCYTACNYLQPGNGGRYVSSGFTPTVRLNSFPMNSDKWECIRVPLKGGRPTYNAVYAWVLQLIALRLSYNERDLIQCCIRGFLPFEKDYDCENPNEWEKMGGVYCSQVCLLLLKRLVRHAYISLPVNIESVHSMGCSPNDLYRLLLVGPQ